jgi:hypothetical protein
VYTKIYPVGKLLWSAEPIILPFGSQELFLGWATQTPNGPRLQEDCPEEELIDLIRKTIQPISWRENGGRGTIDYFPTSQSLVVYQTPDIQKQIADLLAALGRVQESSATPPPSMPVPPPAPIAPPPPGAVLGMVPPMPPIFAERVPPPHFIACNPILPPLPGLGPMPLSVPTASMQPCAGKKTYILEAKWMQKNAVDPILGVGVNSAAVLSGTIVRPEEDHSVIDRTMQLVFCPDPSFCGCYQLADAPGKEIGTWLLQVKAKRLKSGRLHLDVVNVEGKTVETNHGKITLGLTATPVVDRSVKVGETVKKSLEKDQDGTFRRWLELTVREIPMSADCPPPAGAPTPAPVPTGMLPMPCLPAPLAYQPVCPAIAPEPVMSPYFGIRPASGILPSVSEGRPTGLIRQSEEDPAWNLRPIVEEGKSKLIVREGDRDSVTLQSVVVKIPGNDPLKLTAAGSQIRVRNRCLEAHADKVCRTGEAGCFLFEGHVKLTYKKDGEHAKVTAERVFVNLADGRIEIQEAAKICPAPPLDE